MAVLLVSGCPVPGIDIFEDDKELVSDWLVAGMLELVLVMLKVDPIGADGWIEGDGVVVDEGDNLGVDPAGGIDSGS